MSNILRHEYTVIAANPIRIITQSTTFDLSSTYEDRAIAPIARDGNSNSQVPKECEHI